MDEYNETILEHKVSSLIEQTFPAYYRENGQVLIQFVKEYFKWLEGSQVVSNTSFVGKGYLKVSAQTANITGIGTNLDTYFSNGDTIAVYKQDVINNYDLVNIDTVVNSSFMTLSSNTLPKFSSSNSWYTSTYEQFNPNYYLRRYLEDKDIDLTTDQFLIYFKEKYLKNILFTTATDIRILLKHSLDIYRSKGTERSVDLLFRAVFGVPASLYYPGTDVFKLSDGQWYIPTYLEISLKEKAQQLIGKQIIGLSSGATAFAESLVRRTVKDRLVDLIYISSIKGNFQTGETINSSDSILSYRDCPTVIGSLSNIEVDIDGTGANYNIGDILDVYSDFGEQGKGLVRGITNTTGQVIFSLANGGYAYQANSQVLVSENIVTIANVNIGNNGQGYVSVFDQFVQPLANISYGAITSNVVPNNMVFTYFANNLLDGTGVIIQSTPANADHGSILVSVLSGNLNYPTIYTVANAKSITTNVYSDATVTGNTIGYYANTTITAKAPIGNFIIGEEIYQNDQYGLQLANGSVAAVSVISPGNNQIKISNSSGVFQKNILVRGRTSNASANLQTLTLFVGLISVSNTLYSLNNNYVYFTNSGSNGTVTNISAGSLANVSFSNSLIFTETVFLANDYIRDYLSLRLNATAYGFPGFPSGNLTNGTLAQMFSNQAFTVGRIQQLTGINKGSNYTLAPIVKIYDPATSARYVQDVILTLGGESGVFLPGEVVTQTTPSSRGLVKFSNSTQMRIQQLRLDPANNFVITNSNDTLLVGAQSLSQANVIQIDVDNTSAYLGFNAEVNTSVITSQGAINNVKVFAAGFGYKDGDSLRMVKTGTSFDSDDAAFGFANIKTQGFGEGFYKQKGGFLSDQKKLFDGRYYQNYSYEIRTSVTLNKYEEMLKQILHVAGTQYFGALLYRSYIMTNTSISTAPITQA